MAYYMLTDEHGNELCDGLSVDEYARVAAEHAERLGIPVYAWVSDEGGDQVPDEFLPGEP